MKYRYTVEPRDRIFRVTREVKSGDRYIPDPSSHPVVVTNHEMFVVDLPALFEHQDLQKLRDVGGV